ncbi:phenylacetic acid degradation operon negative regulatory protein [Duganella sp. 1411]|uniref:PaaX family transcriptional regulator C-terminal domain-containing protein n=1 Tax=Duganella sp. 1411 TaxID=2806572 RepID=UPI001AE178CF|nr:PaaX family transcriptional regulator C-terminal domain-containing protein [Duganella sp. 1411]MBP1202814.1 phenylacetic acid degradation operon negative regulatory protein [Duganella sp. 1411]
MNVTTLNTTTEQYLDACLRQIRPRLSGMLKLMFGEAHTFGVPAQWVGSAIALMEPLNMQERATRTALFRLNEQRQLLVERHGRRSLCRLAPAVDAALTDTRRRLDTPPARSFGEDWTLLVNSGGLAAARYAAVRKQLQALDYCLLAPNVLARPLASAGQRRPGMPAAEDHGLALFEVSGAQLAAAVRQPLFGKADWDLDGAAALYRQFEQRFAPLRRMLGRPGAVSDEQAYVIRLLVSHGYLHCRRSDPLLPRELLPEDWPAMTAYQTYLALYGGCASQARRHILKVMASTAPETKEGPAHAEQQIRHVGRISAA